MTHGHENRAIKILSDNISDLSSRRDLISDELNVSFQMLADELRDLIQSNSPHGSELSRYKDIVAKYCSGTSVKDTVALLEHLTSYLPTPISVLSVSDDNYEIFSDNASSRIAYVKSNYTDSAFLAFSRLISSPKAVYAQGFDAACEDVYNGSCDYCILPIESVANGKLFGFYSLIDKYDLKIFAVCDIDEALSSNRTRYALISRKLLLLPSEKHQTYLEFSLIDDSASMLSEIMEAAHLCSLELYRINTIPVPYDDVAIKFYHVFDTTKASLWPYLMFLDIKYPSCKIVGQYIKID